MHTTAAETANKTNKTTKTFLEPVEVSLSSSRDCTGLGILPSTRPPTDDCPPVGGSAKFGSAQQPLAAATVDESPDALGLDVIAGFETLVGAADGDDG